MNILKKYLLPAFSLLLALSLAACGSAGSADDPNEDSFSAPDSFDDMVRDSEYMADFSVYGGTWTGEDGSTLTVEMSEDGGELRFALYAPDEDLTASGYIQYAPEYACDYFYNEHDGVAYRSWSDEEDGALHIISLGTFTKVSGDLPGENIGDLPDETAGDDSFAALAGAWYLDGAADAASGIEIDEYGNWTLYERANGDGDMTEVDCGTLSAAPDGEGLYFAVSTLFDDVVYDITVADTDVLYWGGEYDCYQRAA